jgi:hypothetical protein
MIAFFNKAVIGMLIMQKQLYVKDQYSGSVNRT